MYVQEVIIYNIQTVFKTVIKVITKMLQLNLANLVLNLENAQVVIQLTLLNATFATNHTISKTVLIVKNSVILAIIQMRIYSVINANLIVNHALMKKTAHTVMITFSYFKNLVIINAQMVLTLILIEDANLVLTFVNIVHQDHNVILATLLSS